MNFFEQQLRFIVGNQPSFENAKYIGRACIASLDGGVKLKAEFIKGIMAERFIALQLTAINPSEGAIDSITLKFEDYFKKRNGVYSKTPYIQSYKGDDTCWIDEPSIAEKAELGDAVQEYAELFEQQQSMEMTM